MRRETYVGLSQMAIRGTMAQALMHHQGVAPSDMLDALGAQVLDLDHGYTLREIAYFFYDLGLQPSMGFEERGDPPYDPGLGRGFDLAEQEG